MAQGRMLSTKIAIDKELNQLSLEEYRAFSPLFGDDVRNISLESSVASRAATGGTAPASVGRELARARELLRGDGND